MEADMRDFTAQALQVIRGIPAGRVMTYGQIAACAGSPRGARQVVRILHAMSEKHGLPWHRVINARGEIGLREPYYRELQLQGLEDEGVELLPGGRVDLERYRHEPGVDAAN
jgi:methylated-DNA-protein-cysteine methyltransferase-like protein